MVLLARAGGRVEPIPPLRDDCRVFYFRSAARRIFLFRFLHYIHLYYITQFIGGKRCHSAESPPISQIPNPPKPPRIPAPNRQSGLRYPRYPLRGGWGYRWCPEPGAFPGGCGYGGFGRETKDGFHSAQADRRSDELQRADEAAGGFQLHIQLEGQHPSEPPHLPRRNLIIRVGFQSGIVDPRHPGMRLQELRQS